MRQETGQETGQAFAQGSFGFGSSERNSTDVDPLPILGPPAFFFAFAVSPMASHVNAK